MICVVIQARLDSTRLPQKALLSLADKPLIVQVMNNAKRIPADSYILACDHDSEQIVTPLAVSCGYRCIAGPKEDVLERFCLVIRKTGADVIVQVTGDNPFIFIDAATESLERFLSLDKQGKGVDYFTFSGLPHGSGVEILSARRLLEAAVLSDSQYEHEHVGPALYNHPERFACMRAVSPEQWMFPEVRTTVDTRDDYERVCLMAEYLASTGSTLPVSTEHILKAWNYVTRVLLFYPSFEAGQGTGHFRRVCECIQNLKSVWRCQLYISRSATLQTAIPSDIRPFVVHELPPEAHLVVVDKFRSSIREIRDLQKIGPVVALDERGSGRSVCDYVLDIIPGPGGRLCTPNLLETSFLPLPQARKQEPVQTIRSVLVVAGGENSAGLAHPAARALARMEFEVTVIDPGVTGIRTSESGYTVSGLVAHLKENLCHYDLVVTHYGFTAFEALAAGCKVILFSPTWYHYWISRKYGFSVMPPECNLASRLLRLISSGISVPDIITRESVQSDLPAAINHLARMRIRTCPFCGSSARGPVLLRAKDRTVTRCGSCSMDYISFQVDALRNYSRSYFFEEYKAQYGKTYLEDFEQIKHHGRLRISRIDKSIRRSFSVLSPEEKKLLDIGCAYGPFLSAAREAGWLVYGTDISPDAVEYVAGTLDIPAWVSAFPAPDAYNQISSRKYAAVTMWYVIEHLEDLESVFSRVRSLLLPGGIFAFSTPSSGGISGKTRTDLFYRNSPADHITIWNHRTVRRQLKKYGFTVLSVVSTGHHPERFPFSVSPVKGSFLWHILGKISQLFSLGDTFEVYAVKQGSLEDAE